MKSPAFQFYAADFLVGTAGMSNEDVGIYIRLLSLQWEHGSLPSDAKKLRQLVGSRRTISDSILAKFKHSEDGSLRNARLESEREKQRIYRESRAANAKKRWNDDDAHASKVHKLDGCSPSPSSSPIPKEPTIAEASPSAVSVKPRKEPEAAHGIFIKLWTEAYPTHHGGEAYVFQGAKDGTAVKQLLTTSRKTPEDLMRYAVGAWKHSAGFNCRSAASLCGFNSKFNDISNELRALKNGTNQPNPSPRNVGHNAGVSYANRPSRQAADAPDQTGGGASDV